MMKKNIINIEREIRWLFVLLYIFSGVEMVWADGSKDLYPNNATGGRAYLRASTTESVAFPFPNLGTHYVYAEAGEQIAIATNAQSGQTGNNARIRLYGPTGTAINLNITSNNGNIPNRSAELAGPRLPNQSAGGNRYAPIYYTVPPGGGGIYKVEFRGTAGNTTGDVRLPYSSANTWPSGGNVSNSNYLIAWDISVAKQTGSTWNWQTGRVYTTVLNLDNPSFTQSGQNYVFRPNSGFHGKVKVLTRDGYVYNVDNNGSQGISFTFMVNNRGFHAIGNPNTPSYQSIDAPDANAVKNRYHDPRIADSEAAVTQKIFYVLPDGNMPESAMGGPVDGAQTWLRIPEKNLNVDEITVEGVEGTPNQLGNKGAYIKFFNESGGDYYITIRPKPGSSTSFPERQLTGSSSIGQNKIHWDGKDGAGNPLPHGLIDVEIELNLRGAEVHFPYIDMELNANGIIIELLETDLQSVKSDKVYWNDQPIGNGGGNNGTKSNPRNAGHTVFPNGTSSNTNGHKWGENTNATSGTFGDEQGMDTWTFIEGDAISIEIEVAVRIADLEISSIVPNKPTVVKDEEVTFTIKAKNNGPDGVEGAPFSFIIPDGYEPVSISFDGNSCGVESDNEELEFDGSENTYHSKLDLPDGCEVTYEVTLRATSDSSIGDNEFTATIMRPNDVTDPDATNSEIDTPPTDPFFECSDNGLGGECNNIKSATIEYVIQPAIELLKSGVFVDVDINGVANVGDEIHYTFTVTNTGDTPLTNITISDPLVTVIGGPIDLDEDENDSTTFTAVYQITQEDINNGGVYNLAEAIGKDSENNDVADTSKDPNPLDPSSPNYDPDCPDCTFVPLKGTSLLITNPMIRQKTKN